MTDRGPGIPASSIEDVFVPFYTTKKEGKILAAIIDVLEELSLEVADLWDDQIELAEGMDVISDDLADIEDIIYDELDDEDEDEDEEEYYEDELGEDEDCYATTCPTCEETIYFDESVLEEGEVICPNCGEKLEFDLSSLEEECDCEGECDCDKE